MREYYIYILANRRNGTLYTGVTNNLLRRVREHKEGLIKGFTQKYKINKLVYFESGEDVRDAIEAEKKIKHWNRKWKLELIQKENPYWNDLYWELVGADEPQTKVTGPPLSRG
ncbi:MAG: GIY-YIG nuclease family protein [Candidatus Omnitrophica bacterium]|nr:GIY-YIG nuclease family protein [Candidatus Omnitrophota bacterium]